ncbi:hypothetical protein sce2099 [Sorangium cellulosum So ce56]|uniref:PA14 domain-containing protein n=1 Tax=Sorangium cellulosum (strain So ce56) TaxID=448385 RepID=A9FVB6_SORC5|nr:putative baseplate assembly protein [Sorangium cellulosum]CAN92258.1 hypothetical protein sce2099 [Sorangium cellulosum So ce56]
MSVDVGTGGDSGCCEGTGVVTPIVIENRPGLPAIAYRVGVHSDFLQSMLASLTDARRPVLGRLRTREPDDFTIALLDAWAVVADVLTFYQERIANEAYLRTATERVSVIELARLIGYALRPGVAASVDLVFTLESAQGAPPVVPIPSGTRVQSVPGPNERPQTYETVEDIVARPELNALRPILTEPQSFPAGLKELWLDGVATGLKPGDAILIVGEEREGDLSSERWDFRRLVSVTPEPPANRTHVTWREGLGWKRGKSAVLPAAAGVKVFAFRQRAGVFGGSAPDWRSLPNRVKAAYLGDVEKTVNEKSGDVDFFGPIPADWPDLDLASIAQSFVPSTEHGLTAAYYSNSDFSGRRVRRIDPRVEFDWGTGSPHPSIGGETFSVRWMAWLSPESTGSYTFHAVADDGVRVWVNGQLIIDFWKNNAGTPQQSVPIYLAKGRRYAIRVDYYENEGAARIKLQWSTAEMAETVIPSRVFTPLDVDTIHLDGRFPSITEGSWAVVATPEYEELYAVTDVADDARMAFTLSAKTTRLTLEGENLREVFNDQVRRITVYAQSEELKIAPRSRTDAVEGTTVLLDRLISDPGAGRRMIIAGTDVSGAPAAEIVKLVSTDRVGDLTQLTFASIAGHYRRDAVAIFGNVAPATHGETTPAEVLGSGDAGQAYQRFKLRQAPLTYVSADVPSGGATTLEVRVDDVRWHEVPTLLGRGPKERVYVTQTDEAGKVTVQFGDGRAGARLPTGSENVIARYRKGIGREGLVAAGQLSLLLTRPLGVRSVVNPLAPSGAADPQSIEDTQQNAPLSVLTLDRIVSLKDYEDFARSYAGIAKAHAAWTWNGDARGVLLTVAGVDGDAVLSNTRLYDGLTKAIKDAGDPSVLFDIKTYTSTTFTVSAGIGVDADFEAEKVLAAVVAALRSAFSFTPRAFGHGVFASEVIAVIQRVPGVRMVDLDAIVRVTGGLHEQDRADFLQARAPVGGELADTAAPAELLTLTTLPLTELKVIA